MTNTSSNSFYLTSRIQELNSLLSEAKSQTSKNLINQAIKISLDSFALYQKTSTRAIDKIQFLEGKRKEFDEKLALAKSEFAKFQLIAQNDFFSDETKQKVIAAAVSIDNDLQHQYNIRVNANFTIREAILYCNQELGKTLLEYIFKPNASSFIADSILDALKALVQKLIPYSDDIETIFSLSVSKRKKNYLSDGDKLLSYLEDYISMLNTWSILCLQFEKEVLSD